MANDKTAWPPVGLINDLGAVDHPQYIPGSPHNLPPSRDRSARRSFLGLTEVPSQGSPGVLPTFPERVTVYDPHHYAAPIEGSAPVSNAAAQLLLLQPQTRRNYLVLRNASPAAQNIFVAFGSQATATSALRLTPNQVVFLDPVPQTDMYALADAAGARLSWSVSTIAA
jgi:hypothetical protein